MNKEVWYKILKENTLNEKKNDFVARYKNTTVVIHNSDDEDFNQRIYDNLKKLITTKPKKIEITY